MLHQTSRLLLPIVALAAALTALGPAFAEGVPPTAFQQWLQAHGRQFGLQLVKPAESFAPGFGSGDMEIKFSKKMGALDAADVLKAAVAEFCGPAMVMNGLRPACSSNGTEWLVVERPDPITSDLGHAIWKSISGNAAKPDSARRLAGKPATSFRVGLLEAPLGEQNDPRFRPLAISRGSLTQSEWAERDARWRRGDAEKRQADAARAEAARLKAERPRKVLAGSRVCQVRDDVTWLGFTEAYSKDTDRIQIRIVGAKSTYRFEDRQDMTWDSPDNWRLCE